MKLAIVRTSNGPLDIDNYNIQEIGLAKELVKKGVSVDLYSTFKKIQQPIDYFSNANAKLKLIPIKGFAIKQITYFPFLIKRIFRENYDYIQVHEDSQLMNPLIINKAKKNNVKTILYQGMYQNYNGLGLLYQYFIDLIYRNSLKKNTDIVFSKTILAKEYLKKKGYRNIDLLPVGLDFKEEAPSNAFDDIMDFNSKFTYNLLYIGVLESRRDISFILDVIREIKYYLGSDSIGFLIIGNGPDAMKIDVKTKSLGLRQNVKRIESIPNNQIGSIYKSCDLFVLPSHYEIYGMVVLEALFYGIPVFSSRTAGPQDIITTVYQGKVLEMEIKIWSKEMVNFLKGKYMHNQYREKRKEYIQNNFSWKSISNVYFQKITELH